MVGRRGLQQGVTYLALLLAIAMVSGVLAATSSVVSQAQRREREQQLLWAGEQYRRALLSYVKSGDGSFPRKLEELLEDRRGPVARRHIRRLYDEPMMRGSGWGLLRNKQGGIVGVYSRSTATPLKTAQFPALFKSFAGARRYADWKFSTASLAPAVGDTPDAAASAAEMTAPFTRRPRRPARGTSAPVAAASAAASSADGDSMAPEPTEPAPDAPETPESTESTESTAPPDQQAPEAPIEAEEIVPDVPPGAPPQ